VIVEAVTALLNANAAGVYNVACEGYATIQEIAEWIGFVKGAISETDLHKSEHLYLVNSIMDLSKLRKVYEPPTVKSEIMRCWEKLQCRG